MVTNSKERRQQYRSKLGTLQSSLVQQTTEQRYAKWFELFVLFLQQELGHLPAAMTDYDLGLGRYIQFLWQDGEPKSAASVTLAAVQHFVPSLKRNLPGVGGPSPNGTHWNCRVRPVLSQLRACLLWLNRRVSGAGNALLISCCSCFWAFCAQGKLCHCCANTLLSQPKASYLPCTAPRVRSEQTSHVRRLSSQTHWPSWRQPSCVPAVSPVMLCLD